jgi:CRP/FNR family transcriptional regulator, anaerobic regulatory protein
MEHNLGFTDHRLLEEIGRAGRIKSVSAGMVVMVPGDEIVFIPIVQHGVLRIMRQNEDGKEVFLYHLFAGQTCAMSVLCCQSRKQSSVKAIAEEQTELLLIPITVLDDWMKYPEWKLYINNSYAQRFAELLDVIDLIAFHNMDKQVLHYLQQRSKAAGSHLLNITHQQIGDDLGTHREAISRLLRTMEEKGIVRLGRNTIEML